MLSLLVVLGAAPVSVAAPGFQVVGLEALVADSLLDRFVARLGADGRVKVTTARDIAQALGVERQKQLLGCAEVATSCLAELAGALDADVVLSANIVKAGSTYTVNLRFVGVKDARALVTASERVTDLDALQDWLDRHATEAAGELQRALAPPGTAPRARSPWPWIAAGGSLALAGVGVGLFAAGKQDFTTLTQTADPALIETLVRDGPTKQRAGVGLMVGGGALLAASLAWALLRTDGAPSVSVAVAPDGAAVFVQGRWP